MNTIANNQGWAVLSAHPGHELVIHGFMERAQPLVAILTDGSGSKGVSRVDSTTRVLDAVGAAPSDFYGVVTDQRCYSALLAHDHDFFVDLAEKLAGVLVAADVKKVVGDAREGWNPLHDIWRSVADAAIALASYRLERAIENFDFILFGSHRVAAANASAGAIFLQLDGAAYERKIASGLSYPELHEEAKVAMTGSTAALVQSPELSAALDKRLTGLDAESFRVELLRPVRGGAPRNTDQPVYELYGEMMVAAGRYEEVLRYEQHLAPVETTLRQHVGREIGNERLCASSSPITT
jgi:nucleotide-binding universal stress UspA family protein